MRKLISMLIAVLAAFFGYFFIFNGSLPNEPSEASSVPNSSGERQALLFSNDDNLEVEQRYYDALLDYRNESDQSVEVTVLHADEHEELVEELNIDEFPTLVLLHDNQPMKQITGEQTMRDLMTHLRHHFSAYMYIPESKPSHLAAS